MDEGHKLSRHVWVDYTIYKDGLTSQPGTLHVLVDTSRGLC
jgi:hypothetical protein